VLTIAGAQHSGILKPRYLKSSLGERFRFCLVIGGFCAGLVSPRWIRADETAVQLPAGIKAVWDLEKAYRESTATRERICLNGLWRWQPANNSIEQPPSNHWGFFKVPGCWPGISECQKELKKKR